MKENKEKYSLNPPIKEINQDTNKNQLINDKFNQFINILKYNQSFSKDKSITTILREKGLGQIKTQSITINKSDNL